MHVVELLTSGCDQLVVSPTHARGLTLDLLMTDVPGLVWIAVIAPLGYLDQSYLSVVISMAHVVTNLCVSSTNIFLTPSIRKFPMQLPTAVFSFTHWGELCISYVFFAICNQGDVTLPEIPIKCDYSFITSYYLLIN